MQPEGYAAFLFSILGQLTSQFPQHRFLYIFNGPYDEKMVFAKNVLPIITGPKTSNSLRLQYRFNYRIPAILRKHKADVFVSMEGICSLRTKIPQCLLISDLAFINRPDKVKRSTARFYKKYMPAFLKKANAIATVSTFSKNIIAERYKIAADKISVVRPVVDDIFKPLDWDEQELIKEKYTQGRAYFFCNGKSNLINLLKAFSFFKKRQKSNMMLLIAGDTGENFKKEFNTYKFREEVKLLEDIDKAELVKVTGAAYAMIHPVIYDDIALPPLQALQCQVPVILAAAGSSPSVFGEAALYINSENHEDIAQKMMLVFKDEDKTKELVKAGNEILKQHELKKNADLLMQCILKAINN